MSKYITALLILICYSNIYSQKDRMSNLRDSLDNILAIQERQTRTNLDQIDSLNLLYFNEKIAENKNLIKFIADSIIEIIVDTTTPYVYAQALSNVLLEIEDDYSIRLLLNNINVMKYDPTGTSPWNLSKSPCYISLLESNRILDIIDQILHTDYLNHFHPIILPFDETSVNNLARLFVQYRPSYEILRYTLSLPNKNENYNKNLNDIFKYVESKY